MPFRTQQAATYSAPSWAYWSIVADENKAPTAVADTTGYFALPGKNGGAAQVFAGGSNIGIAAKSQHRRRSGRMSRPRASSRTSS